MKNQKTKELVTLLLGTCGTELFRDLNILLCIYPPEFFGFVTATFITLLIILYLD